MGTPIAGKGHTSPLVGTEKVGLSPDGYATTQEIAALGDGSSDAALPAGPTGWTLIPDAPDYESGGTARLMEIPLAQDGGYVTVYQCRFEGDAFPRLVIVSDGSYYIGDGTANPLSGASTKGVIPQGSGLDFTALGSMVRIAPVTGHMTISSVGNVSIAAVGSMTLSGSTVLLGQDGQYDPGFGPVLYAPDSSQHRLVVDNAGVLSTVPFP